MFTPYPTKEEILDGIKRHPPRKHEIRILKEWKDTFFKKTMRLPRHRMGAFAVLLYLFNDYYTEALPHVSLIYNPDIPSSFYNHDQYTIHIDKSKSLISLLHEYGHHLHMSAPNNHQELLACIWSIGLFQAVFPKAYAKLDWDNHMLKRKIPGKGNS